ncbi:MAG: glycosyltransferase family 39 protein [Candidatus Altiarchaeota archaeon]|nr:glycosyltransferase family 39 protein [Candidatus Altiarchaeota archaeon]
MPSNGHAIYHIRMAPIIRSLDAAFDSKYAIAIVLAACALLITFTSQVVFMGLSNSGDEGAYIISARLFSAGRLSIPSPHLSYYYNYYHTINDGKFYGKYPPGWPFFLSIGMLAGMPMLVNLFFALSTIYIAYLIGKEQFSRRVGITTALLMATSPYVIFNSASYFSHTSMLFFTTLFMLIYLRNMDAEKTRNYLWMGLALGIAFNIRPLDAVLIGACFISHYLIRLKGRLSRRETALNGVFSHAKAFAFGFGFLILLFLLYNHLQTGNAFLTPFQKYDAKDKLSLYLERPKLNLMEDIAGSLIKRTYVWVPFSLFSFIAFARSAASQRGRLVLLSSTILILLIVYSMYWADGFYQYGARYLYASASALFILIAAGMDRVREINGLFYSSLALALVFNMAFIACASPHYNELFGEKREVYDEVVERNISNALVFIYGWNYNFMPMPVSEISSNNLFFNDSVIYIKMPDNSSMRLTSDYPSRHYFIWKCKYSHKSIGLLDLTITSGDNCTLTSFKNEATSAKL